MLYIHKTYCISAQHTFGDIDLETLVNSEENRLRALEPNYESIPRNLLRRMGKSVRMSVGAALPVLQEVDQLDGVIIGTANGGMDDCIKFMEQIVTYNETDLTPGNFVQSTPNAIASQIALLKQNKGYNITHSHRGLSFENALLDAQLLLKENPKASYLVGGVDEISSYNYNVDFLDGWYKKETVSNHHLYQSQTAASIAGEGAAMFLVNTDKTSALAKVTAIHTFHTNDVATVDLQLKEFIRKHGSNEKMDLLLSGENGDTRYAEFYKTVESNLNTTVLRFKHMSGEYGTATAQAIWLSCQLLKTKTAPLHMLKNEKLPNDFKTILIYNNYKETQHSLMLISRD
jgi:hypothetical protein